jgi:hypothetical protein
LGYSCLADWFPERQRQFGAGPYVAILHRRYQSAIALEHHHIEHGTHHPEWATICHFHDDFGCPHTLARKAGEAVASGVLQHAIERRTRQAIQSAFPIK